MVRESFSSGSHSERFYELGQKSAYGRVTNANFPNSFSETFGYDANNNLTSKTDRNGHTLTYTYDALNRLTVKTSPDTTSVSYTLDLGRYASRYPDRSSQLSWKSLPGPRRSLSLVAKTGMGPFH